ncbi:hypothetical protein AMS68_000514 [Peltaster fructicola]|uniref:Uncharacterized protein n=1 Tax=Peltaster fructicola TaxID=286661 RepID=A0A6H0XJU0_9PEZI|nr:hypothetical protein AMS68_000514 [Peltaster fructicola]
MTGMRLPLITLTNERDQESLPPTLSPPSSAASRDEYNARWQEYASLDESIARAASNPDHSTWNTAANNSPALATAIMSDSAHFSPSRLRKTRTTHGSPASTAAPAVAAVEREVREHDMHAQHAIDPLSSHIIKRTSTSPLAIAQPPRRSSSESTPSMRTNDARSTRSRSGSRQRSDVPVQARDDLKKGVKAVAFLSRLMGSKKREPTEQAVDSVSVASDAQIEGNEAEVYVQSTDALGTSPRSTQLPNYIKVRSRYKERREFEHLFLAQELQCSKRRKLIRTDSSRRLRRKSSGTADADTVWAMQFSRDGMHLAAGGADTTVRVWKVLSSVEDRKAHEKQEWSSPDGDEHLSAPVFQSQPVREFEGHEAPVLDLSWSKNNFLISSSMDKTVRLWHLSRPGCLCTFKHNDFVTSITFHPKDDRFFLAGSLDSKLRLWNISEKNVAYSISVPDMITAVAFMPDGKQAVAGTLNGSCYWYETEGFKYKTQLQIRPDKGQGITGPKVTAIQAAHGRGGDKVLITSNDSRIRLYNVRDKGCEMVFKGNVNDSSQIRGSLSDDGRYVVCGSEDRKAYIWSVTPTESSKLDKKPVEYFDAHDSVTTSVCIAPAKTRRLLAQSEDPIYDLSAALNYALGRVESHNSSRPATEATAAPDGESPGLHRSNSMLAPPLYKDGNIIVTADYAGKIKVFRQDCASHRRQHDESDRASLFRRGERSSMASSLNTRSSQRSLREAKNLAMSQVASSDRIMSWRQGIAMTPTLPQGSPKIQPHSREASPITDTNRASHEDNVTSGGSPLTNPTSTSSAGAPAVAVADSADAAKDVFEEEHKNGGDMLFLDGNRSYMYWDKDSTINRFAHAREMFQASTNGDDNDSKLKPESNTLQHTISHVSKLSDEQAQHDAGSDEDDFDDAVEHHAGIR